MKIKAALVKEKGAPYEITELELAKVGSKDVLVKIVASGLCRSDYGERNGNSINFPNVLGHEGAGIVEKSRQCGDLRRARRSCDSVLRLLR